MTTYEAIYRGDVQFVDKVDVVSDFSVYTDKLTVAAASGNTMIGGTCNIVGNISVNGTEIINAATGALSNIGAVGCGAVTSTGAIEGTSLTDGTATLSAGGLTGLDSLTLTGALSSDAAAFSTDGVSGNVTCGTIDSGAVTSSGAVSGTSVSDGTVSLPGDGTISGVTSMSASGALSGGSISDGTASLDGSGNLTSAVNGTFSGNVVSAQINQNNSSTISSDGATYTQLSNAPSNGTCVFQVTCNTEDDACGVWIAYKTTGNAGTVSKLGGTVGNTSAYGLAAQWVDTEKPSVKFTNSWGGGTTDCPFKATMIMTG